MNIANLLPIGSSELAPAFFYYKNQPQIYKIYNDGSHYVGTLVDRERWVKKCKKKRKKRYAVVSKRSKLFRALFEESVHSGLRIGKKHIQQFVERIKPRYAEAFPDDEDDLDEYLGEKTEGAMHNFYARVKRFKRKAYINEWNYFVTFTYDGEKELRGGKLQTEDEFRTRLKRCLANLHTRNGWKCMGVFERGEEKERLHYHALAYIPDGEMVGKIEEKRSYSTSSHKWETRQENDFFAERFGVNDMQVLEGTSESLTKSVNYILKYLGKDNERIIYSRGIPTECYKILQETDIASEYLDFCSHFVLYDDVISWKDDVLCEREEEVEKKIPLTIYNIEPSGMQLAFR